MATAKKGSVGKGDLVYIDYDAFLADNGKLFDTTMAKSAKNAGFFDEKFDYSPMPILLGSGKMFESLEKAIEGAAVGKEAEVKIAFADAAGARDPKLVELHAMKEVHKLDVNPYPGLEVQLGNRRGTIMSVGAGRVKVDFNNPLAGKDLIYKFTVKEVIEDKIEKAKAVVKMSLGTSDGFEFTITKEKVTVILPELTKFDQTWPVARFRIVGDLRKIAEVDTIEFVEVWALGEKKKAEDKEKGEEKPKKAKEERPKAEKKAEQKADEKPKAEAKKVSAKAPAAPTKEAAKKPSAKVPAPRAKAPVKKKD
jgi:FKBP-type peptidyl-prolyl cis-trans isomerase SlyD